jgi:pilus assembly protein CpaF
LLGERRSNSLFAPTAPAEPERKPEQAEVHDISFEERTGRSLFAEMQLRPVQASSSLPPGERELPFGGAQSGAGLSLGNLRHPHHRGQLGCQGADEAPHAAVSAGKAHRRGWHDGRTSWWTPCTRKWRSTDFSPSTSSADGIEEIDINSWRDIEIQYSDGRTAKLEEHFDSPEHAANVIRRMLQNSGKVLDNASPIITSRLARTSVSRSSKRRCWMRTRALPHPSVSSTPEI